MTEETTPLQTKAAAECPANFAAVNATDLRIEISDCSMAGKIWITQHIAQYLKSIGMNVACKDEDKPSDYFYKNEAYPAQHKSNLLITSNDANFTQAEKLMARAYVAKEL